MVAVLAAVPLCFRNRPALRAMMHLDLIDQVGVEEETELHSAWHAGCTFSLFWMSGFPSVLSAAARTKTPKGDEGHHLKDGRAFRRAQIRSCERLRKN